jgi:hypothetical protein
MAAELLPGDSVFVDGYERIVTGVEAADASGEPVSLGGYYEKD